MKFVVYILISTILVIQVQGQVDREELKKQYFECLGKNFFTTECNDIFSAVTAEGDAIIGKVRKYKLMIADANNKFDKCRKSNRSKHDCDLEKVDREKIINETKVKLYPWVEFYEMCDPHRPDFRCDDLVRFFHVPDHWGIKPEKILANTKTMIAFHLGEGSKEYEEIKGHMKVINFSSKEEL